MVSKFACLSALAVVWGAHAATVPRAFLPVPGQASRSKLIHKPLVAPQTMPTKTWRPSLELQESSGGGSDASTVGTVVPFELRGFSLATVTLGLGALISIFSFGEYLFTEGSEGLSGIGFVYGFPILLIGLALKYAQLDPVPVETTPEADRLFATKATPTITKIKSDVTRHRYGDDAHLDTTVQALGLVMPNKEFPQLQYIKQGADKGELTFSMVFKSEDTPYKMWAEPARIARYDKFFGPGVVASVEKVDAAKRLVAITLTTGERKPEEEVAAAPAEAESVGAEF